MRGSVCLRATHGNTERAAENKITLNKEAETERKRVRE